MNRRGAILALAALAPLLVHPIHADPLPVPAPPALPPQPGAAEAVRCPTSNAPQGTWALLDAESAPGGRAPAFAQVVDPWMPCRMYRTHDRHALERSVDWGRTWRTVFLDDRASATAAAGATVCGAAAVVSPSCAVASGTFSISGIAVPAPGRVVLSEDGNGDAVVVSDDAGATWHLRDSGIAGAGVLALAVAPSDANTMYALTRTGGGVAAVGMDVTEDGGASWSPVTTPLGADAVVRSLQVDPVDPARLWLGANLGAGWVVLESRDHATTWSLVARSAVEPTDVLIPLAARTVLLQLLVTASPSRPLRWYLVEAVGGVAPRTLVSSDDGASFVAAAVQRAGACSFPEVAADPAAPGAMLYLNGDQCASAITSPLGGQVIVANATLDLTVSADGLAAGSSVAAPSVAQGAGTTPFDSDGVAGAAGGAPAGVQLAEAAAGIHVAFPGPALQADRFGDFYLSLDTGCGGGPPALPGCGASTGEMHSVWRFTPPPSGPGLPGSSILPGGAGTGVLASLPSCRIPVVTNDPIRGTLAYDGRDLLYSQVETGPVPYTALIHRMDPLTCRDTGDITVRFHPEDLAYVHGGAHPTVGPMAYDPRRDVIWAQYGGDPAPPGTGTFGSNGNLGNPIYYLLFVIKVGDMNVPHAIADARLAPFHNGCGFFLTYDYSDDSLWTCDVHAPPTDPQPWGHLRASDGATLPSCVSNYFPPSGAASNWTLGPAGRLYLQAEDDSTITALNDRTCAVDATYVHRTFAEPINEDDEMACDPVSFGVDHALPALGPISVLWLRDVSAQVVTPYVVPGEYCPIPTAVRYVATAAVPPAHAVTLCASLATMGLDVPLTHRQVEFTVDGVDAGYGTSDIGGMACVATVAPSMLGAHAVTARFGGDVSYLGAGSAGVLTVLSPPAPPPPAVTVGSLAAVRGGVLPPPEPPVPPGEPVPQPVPDQGLAQTVAQAQAEGQAQTQAHVQAQVQPAMMPQRQRQHQLAQQTATLQPGLQATAVAAVLAGVLVHGLLRVGASPALAEVRRRITRSSTRPSHRW